MKSVFGNFSTLLLLVACVVAVTCPLACSDSTNKPVARNAAGEANQPPVIENPAEPNAAAASPAADQGQGPAAPASDETPAAESETPPPPEESTTSTSATKAKEEGLNKPTTEEPLPGESEQPLQEAAPAATAAPPGREWNQWGGSSVRNNTPEGENIPLDFNPGGFDNKTGEWKKETSKNIKWAARLGSQSYGNPVVANGKVFAGTNNGAGYLERYPAAVDLGCLLCFNEADGKFLWQHSSEKLPEGRVHDWPLQGICCAPLVENDRLWFVTSRGEVACLDTEGFYDGENDGPFEAEPSTADDEADVIWYLDMMGELKVSQHNMCSCSVTSAGDLLFVCTSNGVDVDHIEVPSPAAPSFMAVDKNTGQVIWTDNSPGKNILHGQWSSPAYAVIRGQPQVIFGGGDGWLYSFDPAGDGQGGSKLLWTFDCNPKEAKYSVSGRSTRNHLIATPLICNGLVYIAVGEDPEHGEGNGHLWCIDPNQRGDVSSELAVKVDDRTHPLPHRRLQAVIPEQGEVAISNPNSAMVWHYIGADFNGDGQLKEFEEQMHRTCGTAAIKNDLLFLPDFSGLVHCVDARTGQAHWTHDLLAATWGSALIVEDKVFVGDEEGKITIFKLSPEKEILGEVSMGNAVYTTPIVADNVLYIANKNYLFAIAASEGAPAEGAVSEGGG